MKTAIGYVRVSTEMQAQEGLSLEAQKAAIVHFCAARGFKLSHIFTDVVSGAKSQRPGLALALGALEKGADVLVVLKLDRLSRSLSHFCSLYERYFKNDERELISVREDFNTSSSLVRFLLNFLMSLAQLEREIIGERTREAIQHIRSLGYHFGRIPFGFDAVPVQAHPRYRVLVKDPAEQAVLTQIQQWTQDGATGQEMADRLNKEEAPPPAGDHWTAQVLYALRSRQPWYRKQPHNERPHTDEQLKQEILTRRAHGCTHVEIAKHLNAAGWVPLKGRRFTRTGVCKLLARARPAAVLTPRLFCELHIEQLRQRHLREQPEAPFVRPGCPRLAQLLTEEGYATPRGRLHWWPGQVRLLLGGCFDGYYKPSSRCRAAPSLV